MSNTNDLPPLQTISQSGFYRLKLIKPKYERIKVHDDKTVSCRLFFLAADGQCLTKAFSSKWPKALAILVGRVTGKFTKEIRPDPSVQEFIDYVAPACGKPMEFKVEAEQSGEWNGKPQFKYKLEVNPPKDAQLEEGKAIEENPPF